MPVLGRQFQGREGLRDQIRLAQVGQRGRAEDYSRGHAMEQRSFYGHSNTAQSSEAETRLTSSMADREHAANRRYEQDQEDNYTPMSDEERASIYREMG